MGEIEVLFPEPAGFNELLFRMQLEKRAYSKKELTSLLREAEKSLEEVVGKLRSGRYSLVDYNLAIYELPDFCLGNIMIGGFIIQEGYENNVVNFEIKYKEHFKQINKEYDGSIIAANMHVVAWRDIMSKKIKARSPFS